MWHVLASSPVDFERFVTESSADRLPRHLLAVVADDLGAHLVSPDPGRASRLDRVLSRVYGQPMHWAMARQLAGELRDGDGVFTTGSDSGIPVGLLSVLRRRKVSFAIGFADPTQWRTRLLGWVLAILLRKRLAIFVNIEGHRQLVARGFGRVAGSVTSLGYTTDTEFFRPPTGARPTRSRMLVAGSGTEMRDYDTLADATRGLDVDVKICFVSPNLNDRTRYTVPDPVPANMELRHYSFAELRALYQEADAIVIPLLDERLSAGLTALFEAIACECPAIMTTSPGLIEGLADDDLVIAVGARSADDIQRALKDISADPATAAVRARRARQHLLAHHSTDQLLARIGAILTSLPTR